MNKGIGSYAFRYTIGVADFAPAHPMDINGFATAAKKLGYDTIQICENLKFATQSNNDLHSSAQCIKELGLTVEIGMNGMSDATLARHIEICQIFDSHFLRVVVGSIGANQDEMMQNAYKIIERAIPSLAEHQIVLGVENHFDLTTPNIAALVTKIDSEWVGAICDTTNSIGFIEPPEQTVAILAPVTVSLHLKDFIIQKAEASYVMRGAILGEGQLDVAGTLDAIIAANPNANCILELTTRRNDGESVEEVIAAETMQIEKSTQMLMALMAERHL